ncbi:MAG: hypothetical protein ACYDGR_14220 [Candidatus Dormibacteria bacterium]
MVSELLLVAPAGAGIPASALLPPVDVLAPIVEDSGWVRAALTGGFGVVAVVDGLLGGLSTRILPLFGNRPARWGPALEVVLGFVFIAVGIGMLMGRRGMTNGYLARSYGTAPGLWPASCHCFSCGSYFSDTLDHVEPDKTGFWSWASGLTVSDVAARAARVRAGLPGAAVAAPQAPQSAPPP